MMIRTTDGVITDRPVEPEVGRVGEAPGHTGDADTTVAGRSSGERGVDVLRSYLAEVRPTPLLRPEEERTLAREMEEGTLAMIRCLVKDPGARADLLGTPRRLAEGTMPVRDLPAYQEDSHDPNVTGAELAGFAARVAEVEKQWRAGRRSAGAEAAALDRLAGGLKEAFREYRMGSGVLRLAADGLRARLAGTGSPLLAELSQAERRTRVARDRMVRSNLRLVVAIARRYAHSNVPLSDLIQEGNMGLMRAVTRFDWRMGVKLATYATWWIRQAVVRYVVEHSRTVRIPCHVLERQGRLGHARAKLRRELDRDPSAEDLAAETGYTAAQVVRADAADLHTVPLDTPMRDSDRTLLDLLSDPRARVGLEDTAAGELSLDLRRLLLRLSPRQEYVVRMRYGLGKVARSQGERTLDEVGAILGVSRERVRQIEHSALSRLRSPAERRALKDHLEG